ncbi:hypothetical protein D1872_262710 [compost metagenome]
MAVCAAALRYHCLVQLLSDDPVSHLIVSIGQRKCHQLYRTEQLRETVLGSDVQAGALQHIALPGRPGADHAVSGTGDRVFSEYAEASF